MYVTLVTPSASGATPLERSAVVDESPNSFVLIRCTLRATRVQVRWLFTPLTPLTPLIPLTPDTDAQVMLREELLLAARDAVSISALYNVSARRENAGSYTCQVVGGGKLAAEIKFNCMLLLFFDYLEVHFADFLLYSSPPKFSLIL